MRSSPESTQLLRQWTAKVYEYREDVALALFPCKEFPHGVKASEVAPVTMKHCTVRSGHKFWGWEIAINHPSKASVLEDTVSENLQQMG